MLGNTQTFFFMMLCLFDMKCWRKVKKKKSVEIQKLCSFALLAWSKKFQEHKKKKKKEIRISEKNCLLIFVWFRRDYWNEYMIPLIKWSINRIYSLVKLYQSSFTRDDWNQRYSKNLWRYLKFKTWNILMPSACWWR